MSLTRQHTDNEYTRVKKKKKLYFEVDHFSRLRSFWVFAGVQHGYLVLFNLLFQITQFPFHLVAPTYLADELALERIDVRIQLRNTKTEYGINGLPSRGFYSRLEIEPSPVLRVRTHKRTRLHFARTTGTGPSLRCGTTSPWRRVRKDTTSGECRRIRRCGALLDSSKRYAGV